MLYYIISGVYIKEVIQHGIITERLSDVTDFEMYPQSEISLLEYLVLLDPQCLKKPSTTRLFESDYFQTWIRHQMESHIPTLILWLIHRTTLGILFFLLEVRLQRLESMYTAAANQSVCVNNSQATSNAQMNQTVTTNRKEVVSRQMSNDFLFLCIAYILLVCVGTLLFRGIRTARWYLRNNNEIFTTATQAKKLILHHWVEMINEQQMYIGFTMLIIIRGVRMYYHYNIPFFVDDILYINVAFSFALSIVQFAQLLPKVSIFPIILQRMMNDLAVFTYFLVIFMFPFTGLMIKLTKRNHATCLEQLKACPEIHS